VPESDRTASGPWRRRIRSPTGDEREDGLGRSRCDAAIDCRGYGAGFYICSFKNGGEEGEATITMTTRGVVFRVTAITCLLQLDRPGCQLD
jgi:hypothetical protein